jgi:hypothetical protein
MTKTLLKMTQDILSDTDGDIINSIFDTEEAEQVANIIIQTHDAIVSNSNWPSTRKGLKLTGRSNTNFPSHMILPEAVKEIISIRYDIRKDGETRKQYKEMKWKSPDDFLVYINRRDNTDATIDVIVDDSGVDLFIKNDQAPTYFTSFDDTNIIFDAYDSDVENTLQSDKTQCLAFVLPTLAMDDDAVPQIPADTFSFLVEESKTKVQFLLREVQDPVSAAEAIRQRRWVSRKAWRSNKDMRYPDYGRKR